MTNQKYFRVTDPAKAVIVGPFRIQSRWSRPDQAPEWRLAVVWLDHGELYFENVRIEVGLIEETSTGTYRWSCPNVRSTLASDDEFDLDSFGIEPGTRIVVDSREGDAWAVEGEASSLDKAWPPLAHALEKCILAGIPY